MGIVSNRPPFCLKRAGLALCLAVLGQVFSPLRSAGQCGNTVSSSTYDTLITTSTGYGNFRLSFPQWRPDSGTLISVKVQALVSLRYGFTLSNADIIPSIYTLRVGREDKITSPSMATYDHIVDQYIGNYPLDPGHSVTVPPFSFLNQYPNTDSITTAIAPFIGLDSVHFAYLPITYTNLRADNNSSYTYRATAADSIRFSVTYLHCSQVTLATVLTRWTATLDDLARVRLSWTVMNEQPGRLYVIQQGRDGQHFTAIDSLSSLVGDAGAADYGYSWHLPEGAAATGTWYFRLKWSDGHGGGSYSDTRELIAGAAVRGGLLLYPNPASGFVNILFDQASGSDWRIDVFDAGGGLLQSGQFPHTQSVHLDFQHKLAAGGYFIRATDIRTGRTIFSPLLVTP